MITAPFAPSGPLRTLLLPMETLLMGYSSHSCMRRGRAGRVVVGRTREPDLVPAPSSSAVTKGTENGRYHAIPFEKSDTDPEDPFLPESLFEIPGFYPGLFEDPDQGSFLQFAVEWN